MSINNHERETMKLLPLGSKVIVIVGNLKGVIVGRAEYKKAPEQYYISIGKEFFWMERIAFAVKPAPKKRKAKRKAAKRKSVKRGGVKASVVTRKKRKPRKPKTIAE